jgi:catechol-2,3-dioxygenase
MEQLLSVRSKGLKKNFKLLRVCKKHMLLINLKPNLMPINIQTPGIHHIALRCTDLARSRAFYHDTLGFPIALEVPNLFIFVAGEHSLESEDLLNRKG